MGFVNFVTFYRSFFSGVKVVSVFPLVQSLHPVLLLWGILVKGVLWARGLEARAAGARGAKPHAARGAQCAREAFGSAAACAPWWKVVTEPHTTSCSVMILRLVLITFVVIIYSHLFLTEHRSNLIKYLL